jgi:hypothetical protein
LSELYAKEGTSQSFWALFFLLQSWMNTNSFIRK